MTARCASCSYPLSVSDSVSCFECLSYFHIDCAQLVGFPYYELSADPVRNTFHCTTCRVLPIPGRSQDPQCAADSDSDCDDAMPSRQLDYHHLEPPGDLARDMHELKGTVQDLSDLCKDMLREINDLKSINLALRCGVENLRHDNEDKDKVLDELRKRIDALEGNSVCSKPNGSINDRSKDIENNVSGSLNSENEDTVFGLEHLNETSKGRKKRNVEFSNSNSEFLESEKNATNVIKYSEENVGGSTDSSTTPNDCVKSSILSPERVKEKRKDWDWRGRRAVELNSSREESDVEEGETEESDIEEAEKAWDTLHKEVESQQKDNLLKVATSENETGKETEETSEDESETKANSISKRKEETAFASTDESQRIKDVCDRNDDTTDDGGNITKTSVDEEETIAETVSHIVEKEIMRNTEDVSDDNPMSYESEDEEEHSITNPTNRETEETAVGKAFSPEKGVENDENQNDRVIKNVEEEVHLAGDVSENESESEPEENEELLSKVSNDLVEKSIASKASSTSKGDTDHEEQQDMVGQASEEERSISEDISDNEREEEADDRSTNTLREDLDDLEALDEVDEGCIEDVDRLEREESETLANEDRSWDKPVVEEEISAAVAVLDEKELLTRSSSLRSLLLDDVVEVDVGKIDEEAEESHDEDGLENVAEEDAETDHELLDEHNEEDALTNGDIDPQGDEHLENIIEEGQDREEHLENAEARLEGEPRVSEGVDEEEVVTEGEQRLGGQSPDLAGEVQPTDVPESLSPQHTEEDLWHYLKESVSMEHPHTVEEFLQSLIGTLQHVPEDLLQPVIVENIKRANSPCSQTDGERVNSSCSQRQDGESSHQDGGSSAPEESVTKTEEALDASPAEDDAGRREESLTQHTSDAQEDDVTRDAEGYSIVEASA